MSEVEALENKAKNGDAEAMYQLGKAYAFGDGVDLNLDKALFWLTNAAQAGHPTAALVLKDVGRMPSVIGDKLNSTSNISEKTVGESGVESCRPDSRNSLKEQERKIEEAARIVHEKMQEIKRIDAEIEELQKRNECTKANSSVKKIPSKFQVFCMVLVGTLLFLVGFAPVAVLPESPDDGERLHAICLFMFLGVPGLFVLLRACYYDIKRKKQKRKG